MSLETKRSLLIKAMVAAAALSSSASADAQSAPGDTHVTAKTRYLERGGTRYAYRRFGAAAGTPLLFLQHYRGGMDHWDPLVTDGFAAGRPVILLDTAGLAGSTGSAPRTIEATADDVSNFASALGLTQADVIGFSIGGYIAQTLALRNPALVRRLILAGTGPRDGDPATDPKIREMADDPDPDLDHFLYLFFARSQSSREAGKAFWARRHLRVADVDPPSSEALRLAQIAALQEWRQPRGERFADLRKLTQPTLVVNGIDDIMVPSINAFHLVRNIPDATLILYPDAGHGAIFQYPERFLSHARPFLDAAA